MTPAYSYSVLWDRAEILPRWLGELGNVMVFFLPED